MYVLLTSRPFAPTAPCSPSSPCTINTNVYSVKGVPEKALYYTIFNIK